MRDYAYDDRQKLINGAKSTDWIKVMAISASILVIGMCLIGIAGAFMGVQIN